MNQRLPKSEKLKQEKIIKQLFAKGKGTFKYPFKVVTLPNVWIDDNEVPRNPQVLVSVSKKKFKKAVDRNRIKRQIREAYRLNKSAWLAGLDNKPAHLAIIYVAKEFNESTLMNKNLLKALKLLTK
ncbi:MAG: ribonuclease P protein component [Flammeovirgaceae bacterium]